MKNSIFISYSWDDNNIIDVLDKKLQEYGYNIVRDIRDVEYAQSIKQFMKRIRKTDYSIIVISDRFLKSENCMREIFEFIKDDNYKDRIIPVILKSAKDIWGNNKGITYTIYWKEQEERFKEELKKIDEESKGGYIEELKHISSIKDSIGEVIGTFRDMKMFDTDDKDVAKAIDTYIQARNRNSQNKKDEIRDIINQVSIGENKEYIDETFGKSYYQYKAKNGISENIYILDGIILRAYYKHGQLISYFLTITNNIKLELPKKFQRFVNNKKLGDFSFYDIDGNPKNADAYTQNGTGHAFYSEEYYFGARGNYYQFYFMLLDYGIFNKKQINNISESNKDSSINIKEKTEQIKKLTTIDSILVRDRRVSCPNTYGICLLKYKEDIYKMIFTYENFDFDKLYNYK